MKLNQFSPIDSNHPAFLTDIVAERGASTKMYVLYIQYNTIMFKSAFNPSLFALKSIKYKVNSWRVQYFVNLYYCNYDINPLHLLYKN